MPILIKKDKLQEIVGCVGCPLNALKVEHGQCFCTHPTKIHKNTLGPVNLGSIKEEVLEHCNKCEFKKIKPEDLKKEIPVKALDVSEYGQVKCPSSGEQVSPVDDCKTCPFFARAKMKELKKSAGENHEVKHILCHHPCIPADNLQLFLDKKTKEDPKSGVVLKKVSKSSGAF